MNTEKTLRDFDFLIGYGLIEAKHQLSQIQYFEDVYLRVTKVNGINCILTRDYVTNRLNVSIVSDIITEINGFG